MFFKRNKEIMPPTLLPPFGIGWLSETADEHILFFSLFLEFIIFTLVGEISWYLLVICLCFYSGPSFKAQTEVVIKNAALYFLPKLDEQNVANRVDTRDDIVKPENDFGEKFLKQPDAVSVGWINDVIEKIWKAIILPFVLKHDVNKL